MMIATNTTDQTAAARTSRSRFLIIPVVLVAGLALVLRPVFLATITGPAGAISGHVKLQIAGLGVAGLVLAATYLLSDRSSRVYWGIGSPAAPAGRSRWLGVKQGESWRRLGLTMLVSISVLLGLFLYIGLGSQLTGGLSVALLIWAVVFAVSNAVTEEIVFRLSLVSALKGLVSDRVILALGAWIFGALHYVGVPGGPIGVLMAAFLGWFLTKSILETRGMFWALLIHAVQDVIIFAVLLHIR